MSDSFPTFRHVGLAMIGIADHFSLMQTVFFIAAAVSVACFGYLFYTTTNTSVTVGRVGERLKIVEREVGDIKKGIGDIGTNMATMQEDMGAIKKGMGDSQWMLSKIGRKDNSGEFFMPPTKSGFVGLYIEDLSGLAPALVNTRAFGGAWLYSKDAEMIRALKETGIFQFRALKETGISQFRAIKETGNSKSGQ